MLLFAIVLLVALGTRYLCIPHSLKLAVVFFSLSTNRQTDLTRGAVITVFDCLFSHLG